MSTSEHTSMDRPVSLLDLQGLDTEPTPTAGGRGGASDLSLLLCGQPIN